MLEFIKKLFNIKPNYNWQYTTIAVKYDLTRHPDISPSSPIKEFELVNNYRYCPANKKLQSCSRIITDKYHDVDLLEYMRFREISELVKNSDREYNRDTKLKKLLKK